MIMPVADKRAVYFVQCILQTILQDRNLRAGKVNPEKPDVPLNKNDAFQKVQKRRVQEKR